MTMVSMPMVYGASIANIEHQTYDMRQGLFSQLSIACEQLQMLQVEAPGWIAHPGARQFGQGAANSIFQL